IVLNGTQLRPASAAQTSPPTASSSPLATGTTWTDTFTRTVQSGLGVSEIGNLPWLVVQGPVSPVNVTGTEAHWPLHYDYTQYNDNAWRLNLGSTQVQTPFETLTKLRVVEVPQATQLLHTLDMWLYLTGDVNGNGVFSQGASSVIELYQSPSSPNYLNIYPYDDRLGSGTRTVSEGQQLAGFWSGTSFWVRMRTDSAGTHARVWANGTSEPTGWQAEYTGTPSQPTNPFQWLGITLANTGTAPPTVDVYLDSTQIVTGFIGPALPEDQLRGTGGGSHGTDPSRLEAE